MIAGGVAPPIVVGKEWRDGGASVEIGFHLDAPLLFAVG
jgi:hypothetical protein